MNESPRQRLINVLHVRDMSQRELSKRTGISKSHLSGYLHGVADRMTLEMWVKIAQALDFSLDWLAGLPQKGDRPCTPEEEELLQLWRKVDLGLIKESTLSTLRAAIALEEMDRQRAEQKLK